MTVGRTIQELLALPERNGVDIKETPTIKAMMSLALEGLTTGTCEQRLAIADILHEFADSFETTAVRMARGAGLSWAEIGDALGTSKQAAHQKHLQDDPNPERPSRDRYIGRSVSVRCTDCNEHIGLSHTGDTASLSAKVITRHEHRSHHETPVDRRVVAKAKDELRSGAREATAGRYKFVS